MRNLNKVLFTVNCIELVVLIGYMCDLFIVFVDGVLHGFTVDMKYELLKDTLLWFVLTLQTAFTVEYLHRQ